MCLQDGTFMLSTCVIWWGCADSLGTRRHVLTE